MAPTPRYNEMRRVCRILGAVSDRFPSDSEEHQVVWDALRAYTMVMQFEDPLELYERFYKRSEPLPEELKASLRRLWIGPAIGPDGPLPIP